MSRRPPCHTLFPYTTLFRSVDQVAHEHRRPALRVGGARTAGGDLPSQGAQQRLQLGAAAVHVADDVERPGQLTPVGPCRSEEHTSELQSQSNLVCRLLLEKK